MEKSEYILEKPSIILENLVKIFKKLAKHTSLTTWICLTAFPAYGACIQDMSAKALSVPEISLRICFMFREISVDI
jgi:hypothetical protein